MYQSNQQRESTEYVLRRLRRDLHDQVGVTLVAVTLALELALRVLEGDAEEAARLIRSSRVETVAIIARVREMAMGRDSTAGVTDFAGRLPVVLTELRAAFRSPVDIHIDIDGDVEAVPPSTAFEAFWIVYEAVVNVLRHARAENCWVKVLVDGGDLVLRVRDDGVGFPSGGSPEGSGTNNMKERAEDSNGWCRIQPAHPRGVLVEACLPVRDSEGE